MIDESSRAAWQPRQRAIRVFVSSTFRDMQSEREELVKRTFPQLRKLCESRGVTWTEVDLRWGVTDEQKAEGQVLPICLDEIRRCRPFFIGLLGERYGWVLDELDAEVLAREPWLAEYRGHSVTEVEMVSGVLANPDMAGHAFFYFRDPAASAAVAATLPPEMPSADAAMKLSALKRRIQASQLPVHENFRSPAEVGELILADFTALIDRLYPEGTKPTLLDQEAALHETFAALRSQVYIQRPEAFDRLDAHVRDEGPPLAVLGESGVGKSALLANWVVRFRSAQPEVFVFMHFIGASDASTEWMALARRLINDLNRHFGLNLTAPDDPQALREAVAAALRQVGAVHRVVIVLDALDQLDDTEQAPDLPWLPRDLPTGVRIIASTLAGRSLDEIVRREWLTLTLSPLRREEREQLIVDYLRRYAKALSSQQVGRIADAPLAGNPLFLTALLEEMRVWGIHETLDDRVAYYLSAMDIDDLFQRILARYEADYEGDRPGLVRDAFTAIWAARHGLSEAELLDLLGRNGAPLPRALWSPLYLAAERSLVNHSGLLGFFHRYLREAVRQRYLDETGERDVHHRLADYFAPRELTARKIAELPWQLRQSEDWERLADTLAGLPFVAAAMKQNSADVYSSWLAVMERIPDAPITAYQPVFDKPNHYLEYMPPLSLLLTRLHFPRQAGTLQSYLFQLMEQLPTFEPAAFVGLAIETAATSRAAGDRHASMRTIVMAVDVARRRGDDASIATAVANEATYLYEDGKMAQAAALFDEAEALARALKDDRLLGDILNNRIVAEAKTAPQKALVRLAELERLTRDSGNLEALSACIGNQGNTLLRLGELDVALAKFRQQEQISAGIGLLDGVLSAINGQALVFAKRNDDGAALDALARENAVRRRLPDKSKLARSLLLQASLLAKRGADFVSAMSVAREQEALSRELGDQSGLASGLIVQANLLEAREDRTAALVALQQAEPILRQSGEPTELTLCLVAEARLFEAGGRIGQATQALKEAEILCRKTGDVGGEARILFDRARLFFALTHMPAAALPDMRRAEALATAEGLAELAQHIKHYADTLDERAG